MPDSYGFFRIRAHARDSRALLDQLQERTVPTWQQTGVRCWGIWQGLFGVGSNELLVMSAAPGGRPATDLQPQLGGAAHVVDSLALFSTARPETISELRAEGLYVFRFFDVAPGHCDEIVRLSRQAWETFEVSDRYASSPQGLFRPRGGGMDGTGTEHESSRMLLVTWYDGFASWETSRAPAPEARENFRRRRELTTGTVACATRLVAG